MSDLSDLELVAQAMAPTNAPPASAPASDSRSTNGSATNVPADLNVDLSKLSPEELAAVQPLLQASSLGTGGDDDLSEEGIMDILKQMDAADGVADDLEGKLDKLLADLDRVEGEIKQGLEKGKVDGQGVEEKKPE